MNAPPLINAQFYRLSFFLVYAPHARIAKIPQKLSAISNAHIISLDVSPVCGVAPEPRLPLDVFAVSSESLGLLVLANAIVTVTDRGSVSLWLASPTTMYQTV